MNSRKTLSLAVAGGIAFHVVWIVLELLFAAEPALLGASIRGTAAGLAWFLVILVSRLLIGTESSAAREE